MAKDKGKLYTFHHVEEPPERLMPGAVYVCYNDQRADLICPCGCGDKISLSLLQESRPRWEVIGPNSIKPSISRLVGCKSHFTITNGITH